MRLLEATPYRVASPNCRTTSSTLRLNVLPPKPSERLIISAIYLNDASPFSTFSSDLTNPKT